MFRRSGDDIIFNADKSVVEDSDEIRQLNGLKGGEKFVLTERGDATVIKFDTDGNGTAEYWCLGAGPTSGRYSSRLLAFSDGKPIFNDIIFDTPYRLKAENGKLYFGLLSHMSQVTDREFIPEYEYVELTTKNGLVFADGLMIHYYNELYNADLVLNKLAKLPEKADPLFLSSDSRAYLNSPHKEELDALLEQVKNAKIERKNPQTKEEENECISELDEKLREFNQLYTDLDNLINTMLKEQQKDISLWYCNYIKSSMAPPFALPERSTPIENGGFYQIQNASFKEFESFYSDLCNAGFESVIMKHSRFLLREDCMIFLDYNSEKGRIIFYWYAVSNGAPKDGISTEKAKQLLMPDSENSLSKIKLFPIEVTPEGFFERTGGQLFAVPVYSYDKYIAEGNDSLVFEDNEHYFSSIYYIKGEQIISFSAEKFAFGDINNDGRDEITVYSGGPTSGRFTFYITVYTDDNVYVNLFGSSPLTMTFDDENGQLYLKGVGQGYNDHRYDIVLEEADGPKAVALRDF